jgi:hypothetical protein
LRGDKVAPQILGMNKIIRDESPRRAPQGSPTAIILLGCE